MKRRFGRAVGLLIPLFSFPELFIPNTTRGVQNNNCFTLHFWSGSNGAKIALKQGKYVKEIQ